MTDPTERGREITRESSTSAVAAFFTAAGFTEMHRPTVRPIVMRIDF